MKTIILATRKGTRLLPLTKDTPQCLLKVGERTILEKQVEKLNKVGLKDITVITGYLSEKIEILQEKLGIKILFNPFYEVSWMALALWLAKEELKKGFVFIYSDVLFDSKIISELLEEDSDICLAIKKNGVREEAEKVVEKDGKIKNISKIRTEEENGEFIGIAKFSNIGAEKLMTKLDLTAKTNLNASLIEVMDGLVKKGEIITAYDIKDSNFADIDFPDNLNEAKKLFG
jgi:L-glutamine-phosphate cytidylyltransferase